MVQGTERRSVPTDSLRGARQVEPVSRQVPSLTSASVPQPPRARYTDGIVQGVQNFASEKLQNVMRRKQEQSMVDGQIAALQGQSFENVQMEGDKWALEGYRAVTAQTMSAELLRAQQHEIANGAYEQDPDAYRARLTERINAMTQGIDDERTRTLAREQLMRQMPVLVDEHMTSNLAFREEQNFNALSLSVDSLSRDVGSRDALLSFAQGGGGSATAGLSEARRREAVASGIVSAFQNNNPAAYAVLEEGGFLTPENLTVQQLRSIEAAKAQFHSRMESQWNAEHHAEHTRIMDQVSMGKLDPVAAAQAVADNNARHGMRMNAAQGEAVYNAARAGVEFSEGTRGINVQAAGMAGDFGLQAALLTDAVEFQESRGNANATSPVGARGLMQLMPDTMLDPGFGLGNIFDYADRFGIPHSKDPNTASAEANRLAANPQINKAMGTDYLEAMLSRYNGDVSRALVAYNWGPGNADNWDGDVASLPEETQNYVRKITASINDDRPDPNAQRVAAERNYEQIRQQAALDTYESMYPDLARMDEAFTNGLIGEQEWRAQRDELYTAHGVQVDMQRLQQESRMVRESIQAQISGAQDAVDADNLIAMQGAQTALDIQFEDDIKTVSEGGTVLDADGNAVDAVTLLENYSNQSRELFDQYGVPVDANAQIRRNDQGVRATLQAIQQGRIAQENATLINHAERNNSVGSLPRELQQRALDEFKARVAQEAENAKAENPGVPASAIDAQTYARELDYISRNNVVDQDVQNQLQVAGTGSWLTPDGKPSPLAAVAVQMFSSINSRNPALAQQYVPDAATRGRLNAALSIAYAIRPELAAGVGQVDLNNPDDPNAQAIYAAVDHIGKALGQTTTPEQDAGRINQTMAFIDRGNLTGTFMGGARATNAGNALIPRSTVVAATSSTFTTADVDPWSDPLAIDQGFRSVVQDFLETTLPHMPGLTDKQASQIALNYASTRGAAMGSSFVMPRDDQPSISVQMFGEQVQNTAAANTAMRQYLTSEMMRQLEPGLDPSTTLGFERGFDYTMNQVGDQWVVSVVHPDGFDFVNGSVVDGIVTQTSNDPFGIVRNIVIPDLKVVGDFYKEAQARPNTPLRDIYVAPRTQLTDAEMLPSGN